MLLHRCVSASFHDLDTRPWWPQFDASGYYCIGLLAPCSFCKVLKMCLVGAVVIIFSYGNVMNDILKKRMTMNVQEKSNIDVKHQRVPRTLLENKHNMWNVS